MERVIEQPMTQAGSIAATPDERSTGEPRGLTAVTRRHAGGATACRATVDEKGRWREIDETAARRTLRAQVAKLECELAALAARTTPRDGIDWRCTPPRPRGPRLLGLGELERVRDDLAERLHAVRAAHAERAAHEALKRDQLARMLRSPEEHRFVRITRADVGEPGCGAWESRPRLGIIGMLAGWWHVKISSGCPLSTAGLHDHLNVV